MRCGYSQFCFLALSVTIFALEAVCWESYSDVDLRVAEKKAIPHYIRHSFEYPDIDIKAIMQQRGIAPKVPPYRPQHQNGGFNTQHRNGGISINHHPRPVPIHRNFAWKQYNKLAAESNHILPRGNKHYLKKQKFNNKNLFWNNKYNKMKKH